MAYRENDKPRETIHEAFAAMWCGQRHTIDLQALKETPWHPALTGFFKDNPETRDAIPQAAREELEKRGERLWSTEEVNAYIEKLGK